MISVSEVVLTAASFLGIGTTPLSGSRSPDPAIESVFEVDPVPSPYLLSQGEAYFEAVAEELRKTGYLDG
ncbi:hypothetical protein HCU64_05300 [Methylobacterium sp. C25]|uniref:hypothetical protein n=1 Tax=Methylobacterium sp. C25 TaxID=2721622 RepID=UPI001F392CE4|nr:hypothetical protein [Methylobacterium sp. C25]MCE4223158.1 hypothetical protein [Methylobacterium sp. C25]